MKVKIVNPSKRDLPHYETKASAGMDFRANLDETERGVGGFGSTVTK